MVGLVAVISLFKLHSWVCMVTCGMSRLGRTFLQSLDCGVSRSFIFMACFLVCSTNMVTRSGL